MAQAQFPGTARQPWPDTDRRDFREQLLQLIPQLRAQARASAQHPELGDDLCQETLVRALGARATFEPGTNFKVWLFAILRTVLKSEARHASRVHPWDAELAKQTLVTSGSQEAALELSEVERAMQLLPADQSKALTLIALGLSYEESAKECACAAGTIGSRVARARRALAGSSIDPDAGD